VTMEQVQGVPLATCIRGPAQLMNDAMALQIPILA